MSTPDFEKLAERVWDSAAIDGKPTWHFLLEVEREDRRKLIRSTWNAAIEEAAGVAALTTEDDPLRCDFDRGHFAGRNAAAVAIRTLKALTTEKEG